MEKLNSETEKRSKKSTRWPPAPAPSSWPTPAPAPTSWPSPAPAPVWTPKPTPGHAHFGPPKPLKRIKEPSSWPTPAPATTLWTPKPKLNRAPSEGSNSSITVPAPAPEAGAEAKPTPGHAHFGPKPGIGHAPATAPEAGAEAKPTSACAPASATPGSVNRVRIFKSGIEKMFWVRVTSGICIIYLTNWMYIAPVTSAEWTLRIIHLIVKCIFLTNPFFRKAPLKIEWQKGKKSKYPEITLQNILQPAIAKSLHMILICNNPGH